MNAQRRKRIAGVLGWIENAHAALEELRDAEQEAFDNMPEGLQESERGVKMEEYIEALSSAVDSTEEAITNLTE